MILYSGLAFLTFWLLQSVFSLDTLKASLVTAIIFLIAGIILERPWVNWNRP